MSDKREANLEFLKRRQKRLLDNAAAVQWLKKQGLTDQSIVFFKLGLSELYVDNRNLAHENALLAPVINEHGVFTNQTVYLNIPEVTVNPASEWMWTKGICRTYYAEKQEHQAYVIVCEDILDLWIIRQILLQSESETNYLLISSTPNVSEDFPAEWKTAQFWEKFEAVYLAFHNSAPGEQKALEAAKIIGYETKRLRPPIRFGETWVKYSRKGGSLEELYRLIGDAAVIGTAHIENKESYENYVPGRFGYKPIDIAVAFDRGHFYYPVETLVNLLDTVKELSGNQVTRITSQKEVALIRSDRTMHTVREEPAPRGTPSENRILRLSDGTLMASRPKSSEFSTWSWRSIEAYLQERSAARTLKMILRDVKSFLSRKVWLPYRYDYDLLTLLVPVTYAQAIFQSVPMILVTGEPGSGKSALGRAMCQICANALSVGQSSAASIARAIHDTKGFVLLDDLESVGKHSKKNSGSFSELVQALKLSYNKETSWKLWTDVRRGMRIERLNFFGVKMINNTTGTDAVLGSRMLKVITRKIPGYLRFFDESESGRELNPDLLRDELHTWTFENVALINATYQRLFPQPSDRAAEIAAPLKVFAEIAGDEDWASGLETALGIKKELVEKPADPIDLMMRAVRNIVRDGYREISTTHVTLEMKLMNGRQSLDTPEPYRFKPEKWESAAWVGRHLRTYGFVGVNAEAARMWHFGKSLRIYPVKNEVLERIAAENKDSQMHLRKKPLDFCGGCDSCAYRELNCPLMNSRIRAEGGKAFPSFT